MLFFFLACSEPSAPPSSPSPPSVAPSAAPSPPVSPAVVSPPGEQEGGGEASKEAPEYTARIAELRSVHAAPSAAIDKGDLGSVHPLAERAVDIAVDLPAKATALSADDQATVALRVAELRDDGIALRDRADAGDAAGAKAALAKVTAEVDALAAAGGSLGL